MGNLNLLKLSVGTESVQGLIDWQAGQAKRGISGPPRHVTRMWPKREAELLDGGSIYWVIKGVILARQRLVRFDEVIGGDGIRRCAIILEPEIIRTEAAPRRAFQGWRYLPGPDAPADLRESRSGEAQLPPSLSAALAEIGVR